MRKKILSAILALAMVVGMAVPAFAANSDVAGDAKKVTKITATKDTYEITVGDDNSVDFADKISVYEDQTKLVLDHNHIRYMLNGNTGSGNTGDFRINGSEVTAVKAGAEATLTIFDNYNASSKARVTVKLKAVAATTSYSQFAESFTFEKSSNNVIFDSAYGKSEGATIVLKAHPAGTKFDTTDPAIMAQVNSEIIPALAKALGFVNGNAPTITPVSATVVKEGVEAVAGEFDVQTITPTFTAAGSKLTIMVAGVTVTVDTTGDTTLANTLEKIENALNANAAVAAKYAVAKDAAKVTLTAKAKEVLPTISAFSDDTAKVAVAAAVTTAGVAAVPEAKGVLEFNLSKAAPVPAGNMITIAGFTSVNAIDNQTVAQQVALWAANSTKTNFTAAVDGTKVTLTQTVGKAFVIGEKSTSFNEVAANAGTPDVSKIKATFADKNRAINLTIEPEYLDAAAKAAIVGNKYYTYLPVSVNNLVKFKPQVGNFSTSTNITPVDAIAATSIQIKSAYDVTVGKTTNIEVDFYPSNSNVNRKAILNVESFRNDGKPWQNAIITDTWDEGVEITGVNSDNKVVVTGNVNGGVRTAFATVTVKPTDFNELTYTSTISAKSKEIKVGEEFTLAMNNLPNGVTVKWTAAQEAGKEIVSFDAADKAVVKVTGKAVGTVVVTATLSNGEKYTCDVDVAAAPVVEEKPTDVPQTGDSFFANLF